MGKSIKKQIDDLLKSMQKHEATAKDFRDGLGKFYEDVKNDDVWLYGEKDPETGERIGGGWKKKTETEIHEKMEAISNLLDRATTAGLAHSFDEYRKDASKSAERYGQLFYGIVAVLLVVGLWTYLETNGGYQQFFENIPSRLVIVAPLIWLALFMSKRRSEFFRLEQEYAHKTAVAQSYLSFKDQIEKLKENDEMKIKLMESALETISVNAAATLDKKHGDDLPMIEALKKTEEFKNILGLNKPEERKQDK